MTKPLGKDWQQEVVQYQKIAEEVLRQAKHLGATQAEVRCHLGSGFLTTVRLQEVEVLEYHKAQSVGVTVYINQKKGTASTTDIRPSALKDTVSAAYRIATLTQPDEGAGLAEPHLLAKHYPNLDLHHPWKISPSEAIEQAKVCEAQAMGVDKRIVNSEGAGVETGEDMVLYANTHGFIGHTLSSAHTIYCTIVARDSEGNMQRDGDYAVSRDPSDLCSIEALAIVSGEKAVGRLGARRLQTCQAPVIFESQAASKLLRYFLKAISGSVLYQKASFLADQLHQQIFPPHITIQECPYQPKGLGSASFDAEGVAPQPRALVQEGVLQSYLLSSYSARRLGLQTTGNAGGFYNIQLTIHEPDLKSLLAKMGSGLLVTEVIGHGINLVTGNYSQGIAGFWVEKGQIQYPVEEVTIAGNLSEMYQQIVAISGDINTRSKIQTGSLLVERMTIAGR
jgi:PmbA protein